MAIPNKILIGSLVTITSLSAFALTSTTVNAEDQQPEQETKTALIRVLSSCTMSGTVSSAHTKNIANGTYASGIGETVISSVCNDAGGFAVYAIGFTGDTDGNNKMVHGTDSTKVINTSTAKSGNTSAWAMRLTAVQSQTGTPTIENNYDDYNVVPDNYVKVASYPAATSVSSDVVFTTDYAAFISMDQTAGTYTGQVKYVMVHPASEAPYPGPPYINPDPDISHDTSHPDGTVFPANSLLRAFEIAYVKANKPIYVSTNDTAHYPTGWKPMENGDTGEVRFAMQDIGMTFEDNGVTKNVCAWAQESRLDNTWLDEALVMDLRDGKSYWIAKLGDSKCWMTQNLDYNIVAGTELNSTTSDLKVINDVEGYYNSASGYRIDSNNVIYWNPNRSTVNSIGSMLHSATDQASLDPGNWYWTDTWYDSSGASYENYMDPSYSGTNFSTTPFQGNGLHGHVGNYYNYAAAVAMNSVSSMYYSDRMPNSVCPAGWQLPNVHEDDFNKDDFMNLFTKYSIPTGSSMSNDSVLTMRPFYLIRGGEVYNQDLEEGGTHGYYFTNGPDSSLAGAIYFNSGWLNSRNDWYTKYEGGSIRCISTFHATE